MMFSTEHSSNNGENYLLKIPHGMVIFLTQLREKIEHEVIHIPIKKRLFALVKNTITHALSILVMLGSNLLGLSGS